MKSRAKLPIIMTSFSTAIGILDLIWGIKINSPFMIAVAVVCILLSGIAWTYIVRILELEIETADLEAIIRKAQEEEIERMKERQKFEEGLLD